MKYLFYLLLTGLLVSCHTDEPGVKNEIPDPINGVSEYLLEKYSTTTISGSSTVTYSYHEDGVLISDDLQVFPANLNSLSDPYVIRGGYLKLFCDSKKRVVKEETDTYHTFYEYDGQDRIERKIDINLKHDLKDTTVYTYFGAGENNFEGTSYQTRSPNYTINPDGSITRFLGSISKNYYFSNSIKLKSWVTYPYNYGKIQDAPMVRYTYTTQNGSLRQETFTHTLDERGLITKTVHNYLGGTTEMTYSYIKR